MQLYLFIRGCAGSSLLHGRFSSCGGRGDDSLFVVHRLFIAVASVVAEHSSRALGLLQHEGSVIAAPRLNSCGARA